MWKYEGSDKEIEGKGCNIVRKVRSKDLESKFV
jgi:hypothetical protein